MKSDLQELRRSSLVGTFGPGAVVDFRADGAAVSAIVTGLEEWDRSFPPPGLRNPQTTRERRLEKSLGVKGFRLPPVADEHDEKGDKIPKRLIAVRFPEWLQCPRCDTIKPYQSWSGDPGKAYRYCPICTKSGPKVFAIPVRFVMACKHGHVGEFPWDWWVGHKPDCATQRHSRPSRHKGLKLSSEGPGLAGLILSCPACGARRPMDGIFSVRTWANGPRCGGRRPWLGDSENCGQTQYAVQRGASNLYFPLVVSALDIPPWSDHLEDILGTLWDDLINLDDLANLEGYIETHAESYRGVLQSLDMSPAELASAIRSRLQSQGEMDTDDLRGDEYRQFTAKLENGQLSHGEFEIRQEPVPRSLAPWISQVVRVVRLREVRAMTGFTRINPPGDPEAEEVAPLSKGRMDWLPAIEVRGEGIFLAFDEGRLSDWERHPEVIRRVDECWNRYLEHWKARYGGKGKDPQQITPRYMLCHTLAHALMRQLALECGYSAASLQERIYAAPGESPMAGILIYTASSDADGTLGGLQGQGKSERIENIFIRAMEAMEWCSSDPLCITDMMGALDSYSHSVCHACALAPETSCEAFNSFLDRALLVGDGSGSSLGYFEDLLRRS